MSTLASPLEPFSSDSMFFVTFSLPGTCFETREHECMSQRENNAGHVTAARARRMCDVRVTWRRRQWRTGLVAGDADDCCLADWDGQSAAASQLHDDLFVCRLQSPHHGAFTASLARYCNGLFTAHQLSWTELTWTSRPNYTTRSFVVRSASRLYFVLIGCSETRTLSARLVLSCIPMRLFSLH